MRISFHNITHHLMLNKLYIFQIVRNLIEVNLNREEFLCIHMRSNHSIHPPKKEGTFYLAPQPHACEAYPRVIEI